MKFRVRSPITMNRKQYRPGELIELTEEQAAAMPWAVEDPEAAENKKQDAAPPAETVIGKANEPTEIFLAPKQSEPLQAEPVAEPIVEPEEAEEPEEDEEPSRNKPARRGKRGRK